MTDVILTTSGRDTEVVTYGNEDARLRSLYLGYAAEMEALAAEARLLAGNSLGGFANETAFQNAVTTTDLFAIGDVVTAGGRKKRKIALPDASNVFIDVTPPQPGPKADAVPGAIDPAWLKTMPPNSFLCNPTDNQAGAAYVNFAQAAQALGFEYTRNATEGDAYFPSDRYGQPSLRMQWGTGTGDAGGTTAVVFDVPFASLCFFAIAVPISAPGSTTSTPPGSTNSRAPTGFNTYLRSTSGGTTSAYTGSFFWLALGF